MKVAALFVEIGGPYWLMGSRIDFWDINRDARLYRGPWPVIAHPPCERWGRFYHGGPSAPHTRKLGDDNGCFESALASVRRWGGVLEHPEGSLAWRKFGLSRPLRSGGWAEGNRFEWSCCVEQGNYGHGAYKRTWLFAKSMSRPVGLIWGECARRYRSFGSETERRKFVRSGPMASLPRAQRRLTPLPFAEVLIEIAANSRSLVTHSQ